MRVRTPGRVLVTGGAGYIGSHTTLALLADGWDVVVADDLSTGQSRLVPDAATLHVGNVGDVAFMAPLLSATRPDAVIHFAGSISVPESVADPLKYYRNNFGVSCQLVQMCVSAGIERFIFSSTAAVYGMPEQLPVSEDAPTQPINPYGHSKLMTEILLKDVAAATNLRYAALRYFNVAGADAAGRSGQVVRNSTNLIKVVAELAAGRRQDITVFGDDYPTDDGTCVRDFIHVSDLAEAHVAALSYLMDGGSSQILNCGYSKGFSVKQVLSTADAITGQKLAYRMGPRRAGDPAAVVAETSRIRALLPWTPRHADLALMLHSAIAWERGLPG
ncbi:MAG: UDP-glucose 4-epimerase GalE [Rhodospirillaceae bacterium]|nr:MAG: UDP-glucose 4-epimerase GalE [Rhodospirillaceae bacterium]